MAHDLRQYLRDKRSVVDARLRTALDLAEGCPPVLREAMSYSLLAPGKRLRPLLVLLACEASGGCEDNALPAGCAVEMIHTYSLIHDDLPAMDDDDLRRGLPTCHKKFGEAMAILAGDALLTLAFETLAASYPPATGAGCCRELARGAGAAGMVGGQVEDLAWEGRMKNDERKMKNDELNPGEVSSFLIPHSPFFIPHSASSDPPPPTLADLEHIHAHKTGALFRASLRMGVWTAQGERPGGPDRALLDRLDAYGRCFGQVFQITDDLLDVESTTEQMGKRVQKDAARGKLTYPGFLGADESRRRAEQLARQAKEQLSPLGPAGDRLRGLMDMILERDR